MFKSLLLNDDQYKNLKDSYENMDYSNKREKIRWSVGKPEKYPCICVYEKRYDSNGPDYYDGEYVYIDDFDGEAVLISNIDGIF